MKYLIVNADDFGMCNAANEAVFDLFRSGRLYSSTIMMPCPAAEDAVRFSIENPQYAIGIHLTLTSEWGTYRWSSLTRGKSLEEPDTGFMWKESDIVEKNVKYDEVEQELKAQINKALIMGMRPSHADNHMGSLYGHYTGRFGMLKLALKVCGRYQLPYRMFLKTDRRLCPRGVPYPVFSLLPIFSRLWSKKYNVILPDYMIFPDWDVPGMRDSYEKYREHILNIWTDIPDGITETYVHPSVECDELKSITARWQDRVWEYNLLKDPETEKYLLSKGVKMISYRDLVEMRKKKK